MFPGAVADRDRADYVLLGAPLDRSTSFRPGTRFGPRQLRHRATPFEDYDSRTDSRFTDLAVHDHGDIAPADDAAEYLEFLRGTVADVARDGAVPLLAGGEHTVSLAALRALDPDVYVTLDAHLDLRERYAGTELSHATVTHHALEVADEAVVLGARSGSEREWERADRPDVTAVSPADVPEWTPPTGERLYLSVDIDAADPGFAPGTGTPEPFGLAPAEMRRVVRAVAPAAVGFDVVEVTDRDHGQAATLGAKLLRAFVYAHAASDRD
ncbi:MAG: arginase family protein [Salinirussus sp.]